MGCFMILLSNAYRDTLGLDLIDMLGYSMIVIHVIFLTFNVCLLLYYSFISMRLNCVYRRRQAIARRVSRDPKLVVNQKTHAKWR